MKKIVLASLLATGLIAGTAQAQNNVATMDVGLSMLELSVMNEFTKMGITDVDPMSLTLSQLAEIRSVVSTSGRNPAEKRQQIETILRRQ